MEVYSFRYFSLSIDLRVAYFELIMNIVEGRR